ncbi:MAG: hypothetical protein K9L56_14090 [Clostridiales bacterium]|nr:hypothetical protein [Clostridiales bacterium]
MSQKYKQVDNSYNEVASLSNATGQSVTLSEIYKSELKVTAIIRNSDTGGATPRTKELVENTHYTFDGVNINGLDGTKYYSIAFSYNALFDSDSYEQQIEEKEQLIEDEWALIDQIKQDSDISNFLSESQIKELQPYIRSRVYRNDNIKDVKTLYEKGQEVLERLNSPKITIEVDTVDLYQSLEYSNQWENIRLGNIITVVSDVIPSGSVLMRIIGIEHSSDQNTMRLTLSNTTSVDDDTFELEELLNKANKASINLSVNSSKYGKYVESGQQNELMNYINSELDLAAQKAKAGSNQNVIVDSHGITLNSTVDNLEKMKILNNLLVITEDNFETASVAISPKGVVAERLIGKAIVGNDLTISNNDSTVRIDGEGITISGGALTITGSLPNEITSYVDGEITDVNTSINTLQSEVDTYSEDLKITKLEANSIKNLWAQVESESADLINIANNLNAESYIDIITQINNYNDALSNLETLLNDFIEHDTVTYEYPITITNTQRDGIETKFSNVQSAKSILITAINESIELKSNNYTDNNAVILDEVYNGVEVNQTNGLVVTASDNSAKSIFNATDGIKLQTSTDGGST